MALTMNISMDHAGIIDAIHAVAAKSVATPEGKRMVIELVAVRKPVPGYAANITFEDLLEEVDQEKVKAKVLKSKKTKVAEKKTLTEQAEESQKKMGTSEQLDRQSINEEDDGNEQSGAELENDDTVSPMDAASAPGLDEFEEADVDPSDVEVKNSDFNIDGVDDGDDVFD